MARGELIQRGELVLFYGVLPPLQAHLARLIEVLCAQSPEESRAHALGADERRRWQTRYNLRRLLAQA